jgi:hypothetical protein
MASLTLTVVLVHSPMGVSTSIGGIQQECNSLVEALVKRDGVVTDGEFLQLIAIARSLRADPEARNLSIIEGKNASPTPTNPIAWWV